VKAARLPPVERLILWDIDGTLVRAGPLAGRAFEAAVEAVTGLTATGHGVTYGGKTDPQIAREILGVLDLHHQADRHIPNILRQLELRVLAGRDELRVTGAVLPGVCSALDAIHRHGVVQTVLTGNTAVNAACKIDAFELRDWLDLEVGAFGSDDSDRNALVPIAVERAQARYGPVARAKVWVIGDTPFDAACARAGGVRCLLVATGAAPRETLDGTSAEHVIENLENTEHVLGLLGISD
jgi:phosphoglycolate phosphatase